MTASPTQALPALRAFVANCLMGGDTVTATPERIIRNLVVFECEGRRFEFKQKPEVVIGNMDEFIGRCSETTEVVVANVAEADVPRVKIAVEHICWLLSFVGTCRVIPFGYEYPDGSGLGNRMSVSGVAEHFRPAFEIQDGSQIKNFVEQVFTRYKKLQKKRKLSAVIDYLAQAELASQLLEVKLLLVFVTLESLKSTYAKSEGIPYVKGFFRKSPTKPGKQGDKYSFEELIELMLHQVGMRRGVKKIVKLRNELIHSGLSQKSHTQKQILYASTHDLIREYLLRLLGYRGRYSPYAFERRGVSAEIK